MCPVAPLLTLAHSLSLPTHCRLRAEVDELVLQVRALQEQRARHGRSDGTTTDMLRRVKALSQRGRSKLGEIVQWQCLNDRSQLPSHGKPAVEWWKELLAEDAAVAGARKRRGGGEGEGEGRLLLARRWHAVRADLQRVHEQLGIIVIEKARVRQWLQVMQVRVQGRMGQGVKEGDAFYLRQHMEWIAEQLMLLQA